MATPSIKELSKSYLVDIAVYSKTQSYFIWSNSPHINHTYNIVLDSHPRYWNPIIFWLFDYWKVKKKLRANIDLSSYHKVIFSKIYYFPHFIYNYLPFFFQRRHKIDQIAIDLNVPSLSFKKTSISIPKINNNLALNFLDLNNISIVNDIIVCMHLITVEQARDIHQDQALDVTFKLSLIFKNIKFIILGSTETSFLEVARYKKPISGINIYKTYSQTSQLDILTAASLISKSHLFIGIDSSMLHIAGALNIDTVAVFNTKKIKSVERVAYNENIKCIDYPNSTSENIYNLAFQVLDLKFPNKS